MDYQTDPMGIDDRTPSLSWQLTSSEPGPRQQAYQVRVSDAQGRPRRRPARGLGQRQGRRRPTPWACRTAVRRSRSRQRLSWSVRVWDGQGGPSPWAKPASWEMGLLEPSDWRGAGSRTPSRSRRRPSRSSSASPHARRVSCGWTSRGWALPLQEGWPDPVSRLQLSEIEAYGGGELRSRGAGGTASESYTVGGVWEPRWLTDGTLDSNRDPRGYTSFERHGQDLRPADLAADRPRPGDLDRRAAAVPAHGHADPGAPDGELPGGLRAAAADRRSGRVGGVPPRCGPGGPAAAAADRGHAAAGARLRARPAGPQRAAVRGRARRLRAAAERRQGRRRRARARQHRLPPARANTAPTT